MELSAAEEKLGKLSAFLGQVADPTAVNLQALVTKLYTRWINLLRSPDLFLRVAATKQENQGYIV